ncbi:hypothetical protein SAMN05446935_8392 [Burkholderia sp. YR290]|nr:hypothetical protein SAMN05446935_8392 [Burkholderia sp. YR290]
MATPPEVLAINQAVKGILDEMRSPKLDPDKTLSDLKVKLKAARLTNNVLKSATDSSGVPLGKYGGSDVLETFVEKKCSKQPGFFKKQRNEAEIKKKAEDLSNKVEEERRANIQERHEKEREKKIEQAQAAHNKGNRDLGHYDQANLIALAKEQAGISSPPVRNSDGSIISGVAMVAAMFDPITNMYFTGRSGHDKGNSKGHVPTLIWNTITSAQVDVKDDAFGKNCAEVDCLLKAFAERLPAQRTVTSLAGLTFVAYKVGEQVHRGPCKTCKSWIKYYGANFV